MGGETGGRLQLKQKNVLEGGKKARKGMEVKEECVKDEIGRVLSNDSEGCDIYLSTMDRVTSLEASYVDTLYK